MVAWKQFFLIPHFPFQLGDSVNGVLWPHSTPPRVTYLTSEFWGKLKTNKKPFFRKFTLCWVPQGET